MENSSLDRNRDSFGSQQFVKGLYFYPKPINTYINKTNCNTIFEDLNYDPLYEAKILFEGFKNKSEKNLKNIINIIVYNSQYRLEKINDYFNDSIINDNNLNLWSIMENQYPKDFCSAVKYIINNQIISDCIDIFNTLKTKNYETLIQIICQSNPFRLKILRTYFNSLYNRDIDNYITEKKDHTDFLGEFSKKLLKGERNSNFEPNIQRCKKILNDVIENYGEDFETDNRDLMVKIFIDSSPSDIQYIIDNYNKDDDNEDFFIENCDNFTNYELYLINSLYMSLINIEKYYASEINLYQPNDKRFIRSIINCYRHGLLENVKNCYQQEFKTYIDNKLNDSYSKEFNTLMKEIIG
jgi:hypothetical protein